MPPGYDDEYDGRPRRRWLQSLTSGMVTLVVIGLIGLLVSIGSYESAGPRAPVGAVTTVILRKGAGVSEVASDLARAGVVRSAALFVAAAEITRAAPRLKAGEYAFPSQASLAQVIRKLRTGDIVHHRITIAEGLTSQQAVDLINASDVLVGQIPTPPEGAILPETYDVTRGEQRSAVLQKMMDARDRVVSELWAHHKPDLPFQTVDQAVTLASIVEKETALAGERPRVAAVYVNRLRQGMKLQADPTVIYGVTGGLPLGRGIRESELLADNPYNTYVVTGLPPGPIDNPGRASLAAVMDPPNTSELYFVADGSGGHAFADTYDEQAKNVAKWRQIEKDRALAAAAPRAAADGAPLIMTISGMTGFARTEGAHGAWTWAIEARSVNGRGLEVRFRGPPGFDSLDRAAREAGQARFARGQISIGLTAKRLERPGKLRINTDELERLIQTARTYVDRGGVAEPRFDGLLSLRGVMEGFEDDEDVEARALVEGAMERSLVQALDDLKLARHEEGAALSLVLDGLVDRIAVLIHAAEADAASQSGVVKERFEKRMAELLADRAGLEDRIVQEAALMAAKADVREELDRLQVNVGAARTLLASSGGVGRKLDFLTQEFMREANTLCSKSAVSALTAKGLDLKAVIEQVREQVQNVE